MKGIETRVVLKSPTRETERSDHCPAMKGIETIHPLTGRVHPNLKKRPLPRNEGD